MTPHERHLRAKEIFADACSRTAEERPAFLREVCRDDEELYAEVESLLAFHDDAATLGGGRGEGRPAEPRPVTTLAGATLPSRGPSPPPSSQGSLHSTAPSTRVTGRFNPGELFAKRYRILSLLGVGGMGEVYQAHDEVLDVPVALKFITAADAERRRSLLNEVRLARRITHPGVCRVYDVGQVGQEYFFTMEYVDGENLASLLRRIGRFPGDKLLDLTHQLCAALSAAHAKGVLHQDLKPANILVDGEGQARITDFGISTTIEASESGKIVGTPAYMPPERLSGQAASPQSDLYALGLVLYEMAAGRSVFEAATPFEYAALHRNATPEPPSSHIPDLEPRLEAAILACLEKDPRRRPASALELAAMLPGGDPLKMAMDAGATPSPDLVARAGSEDRVFAPGKLAALAVGLVVSLVAVFLISGKAYHLPGADELRPPEALADRAREILRALGQEEVGFDELGRSDYEPEGRAWGFYPDEDREGRPTVRFWYRQSPFPLVPSDSWRAVYDTPRVDFEDPPHLDEGMVQMVLDGEGRLVMFYLIPAILEEDQPPPLEDGPNWNVALEAGGFDPDEVRPAEEGPRRVPRIYAEQRRAWTGADPRAADTDSEPPRVHIDAAVLGGRVVYFSAWPRNPEDIVELGGGLASYLASLVLYDVGLVVVVIAAAVAAGVNLRRGRGDLRGARNLFLFVVAAKALYWLFAASHVLVPEAEIVSFRLALGVAITEALLVWLAYIALEPTVRRYWPRTLIAWNRALAGRLRDPLVGKSWIVGALAGTLWALVRAVDHLAVERLELTPLPEIHTVLQLGTALNARLPFANVLVNLPYSIYVGVLALFLLAVLRVVVRRAWIAVGAFVVIQGGVEMLSWGHPEIGWLTLGILIVASAAWILVRFGLLTCIVAVFVENVLQEFPITTDFEAWFSGTGLFALLVPVVLAAFGAWNLLAGRAHGSLGGHPTRAARSG